MITVKNLVKSFDTQLTLSNINYIFYNKTYVLFGKNGVGKTTLMNILSGIEFPNSGELFIDREKAPSLYLESVGIGMSDMSIRENITLLYWVYGVKLTDTILNSITSDLYTTEQLDTDYVHSSLGMKLKIGLSLLYAPINWNLIILDETLSGIDSVSKKIIIDKLNEMNCPRIIVSHTFEMLESFEKIELTKDGILSGEY